MGWMRTLIVDCLAAWRDNSIIKGGQLSGDYVAIHVQPPSAKVAGGVALKTLEHMRVNSSPAKAQFSLC
jgi:hypothetical protein